MSGKLYTPVRPPGLHDVLVRAGFMLGLLSFAVVVVYFEGGLKDSRRAEALAAHEAEAAASRDSEPRTRGRDEDDFMEGDDEESDRGGLTEAELQSLHPDFASCVYYVLITITTVGYGDIVPVTNRARLIDAILLTPIRFVFIFTFFGTAYQFIIQRLQEGYRMNRVVDKLHNHVIVCGYGATGRAAVAELLLQGADPNQIIVLDTEERALSDAKDAEFPVVHGDAASEAVLRSVAIERAAHIVICPGRDDAAVLISLTAHAMNPQAQIIAACRAQENVKLLQRAGAHQIVSAASAGGRLMAAATRHEHLVNTMRDVLTVGGDLMIDEREVTDAEIGMRPNEIEGVAVLRVYRDQRYFDVSEMPELALGDKIVYVGRSNQKRERVST